jgi:hypothetical protein
MKKLIFCAVVTSLVLGACATPQTSNEPAAAAKNGKEDYVTGSRIPRSESNENTQGAKSMTGKDYQEYKASTGLKGGS